ncbi:MULTISPECIES: malonate decarboxylase acyl carrier protein [unclassified Methylobacterium]|uniref:malonate decarboxylase acyl carrier protein n=1 Tax=unclassified Methylobacterium TaxID=2615210 RepID=UPI0011C1E5C4|nr:MULTISPECIES: malonate decarboxylase acyl carrier protein [unclassified Methylobacterium]QEE37757.1 malonate decarboxylase acyl carrier protein [Methylobacterium sp. WL1]TXM98203.1 malonate decarboxylase acyl carrier protein [Methylobacterium sp. WL64]TXN53518.1 malonate decarboxylase acyl carrier protein [Methylobacterium sp. WL2]
MESLTFRHTTRKPLPGSVSNAITGVVASGNLEILLERVLPPDACEVAIETPIAGYGAVWEAVVADFVARAQPGGLRISINDGGARPDTVSLRLLQGARLMEA